MKQIERASKQVNVRMSAQTRASIEALRRRYDPIPSVGEVVRQAVQEKYAREMKRAPRRNGGELDG